MTTGRLHILTTRGLNILGLATRRLNILTARRLHILSSAREGPRSLDVLALRDATLLREHVLRGGHLLWARRLSLGDRRERKHESDRHETSQCSLHYVFIPSR